MSDNFPCPARYLKEGIPTCFPSGKFCCKDSDCSEYLDYKQFNFTSLDLPPGIVPKLTERKGKPNPNSLELSV